MNYRNSCLILAALAVSLFSKAEAGIREGGGGGILEDRVISEADARLRLVGDAYKKLGSTVRDCLPREVRDALPEFLKKADAVTLSASHDPLRESATGKTMDMINDGSSEIAIGITSWIFMMECERMKGINHELFSLVGLEGSNAKRLTNEVAPSVFDACREPREAPGGHIPGGASSPAPRNGGTAPIPGVECFGGTPEDIFESTSILVSYPALGRVAAMAVAQVDRLEHFELLGIFTGQNGRRTVAPKPSENAVKLVMADCSGAGGAISQVLLKGVSGNRPDVFCSVQTQHKPVQPSGARCIVGELYRRY